jgi:cyclopropane-fatty-acyl-phospholipid synthase
MSAEGLRQALAEALPDRPFAMEWWDGGRMEPTEGNGDGPTFKVTSPLALSHILRSPSQLGVGRAYVSGALDVDDIDAALELLDHYTPPPIEPKLQARLALAALRSGALRHFPAAPDAELRPKGKRHSPARDRRAVRHHYDVSNDFFKLFLDESMTYSCGIWSRGATTLEEAQATKLELVCTKLELQPGQRVLDVGCGWASFAMHAAREHGVKVVGVTLSESQCQLAKQRVKDAGLEDQVEIRFQDYREVNDGPYDAISSIGMVEHVGSVNINLYAATLARLLKPGGRLLNHGIGRLRHGEPEAGPFSERFVFPDGAPLHLSRIVSALESANLEPVHAEGFRMDYARTLQAWTANLEANAAEGIRIAGPERMRVWQLYLRAARRGFESGFLSVYQVRARKPG